MATGGSNFPVVNSSTASLLSSLNLAAATARGSTRSLDDTVVSASGQRPLSSVSGPAGVAPPTRPSLNVLTPDRGGESDTLTRSGVPLHDVVGVRVN